MVTHFLIDYWKSSRISENCDLENNLWMFLIDQTLHIFILLIASYFIGKYFSGYSIISPLTNWVTKSASDIFLNLQFEERLILVVCLIVISYNILFIFHY